MLSYAVRLQEGMRWACRLNLNYVSARNCIVSDSSTHGCLPLGFTSVVQWTDDRYDQIAHEAVTSLGRIVTEKAKLKNLSLPFLNPNDATFSQQPLQSFGAISLAQLKATSAKYDEAGVFQKLQNGGFLLSRDVAQK